MPEMLQSGSKQKCCKCFSNTLSDKPSMCSSNFVIVLAIILFDFNAQAMLYVLPSKMVYYTDHVVHINWRPSWCTTLEFVLLYNRLFRGASTIWWFHSHHHGEQGTLLLLSWEVFWAQVVQIETSWGTKNSTIQRTYSNFAKFNCQDNQLVPSYYHLTGAYPKI